jgi:glyoxylase-like metal-dependent hydrolase (beta-lactamase superfamily II)
LHDGETGTLTYIIGDRETGRGWIIDPVAHVAGGFQPSPERLVSIDVIAETHLHADHITPAAGLKDAMKRNGAVPRLVAGQGLPEAAALLSLPFNADDFCALLEDGARFSIGALEGMVLHVPGHTPGCVAYLIGDAVFSGDAIFMPDFGTARCDFPGGDATILYHSVRRLLSLPPSTRQFDGHDYGAGGLRPIAFETTIGAQCTSNINIRDGISIEEFCAMRRARDAALALRRACRRWPCRAISGPGDSGQAHSEECQAGRVSAAFRANAWEGANPFTDRSMRAIENGVGVFHHQAGHPRRL